MAGSLISMKITKSNFSLRNTFVFFLYGFCVTGPLPHFFYASLPKLFPDGSDFPAQKRLAFEVYYEKCIEKYENLILICNY